ncbi:MAG: TetR/AcrR family transcriptional regulator [Calothrix sp. MO_167.B12]|nr:TetR/AcrR family transcriptional regulator [Calothrix sp. MO_167.B12]
MKSSRRAAIGLEKREQTRATLIAATYQVVARKAVESVTIDDIIAEAGVARGTFYNYFQGREDVLKALVVSLRKEMRQMLWKQTIESDDRAERMAIAIRQLLHRALEDKTWGWVIARIGLAANPLGETLEEGMLTDLETGIRLERFQVDSIQAAITMILGTGLMALRSILEGQMEPDYPEQITKIILKSLGISDTEAEAIAFKSLEAL